MSPLPNNRQERVMPDDAMPFFACAVHSLVVAMIMGIVAAGQASAQVTSAAKKRELQRHIEDSRAVIVNPTVIQRSREVLLDATEAHGAVLVPELDEAATTPILTPDAIAPSAAAAADPAPTSAATSADAVVVPTLTPGQLAYVQLAPSQERAAQRLLGEKVASADPANLESLQSFQGAIRQLAADDQEMQLKSYVLVGQPLQYVAESGQFVGTILIGVADLFGEGAPRVLTVPLQFEVLESALADPQRVALKETSPPYERIRVTSRVIGQPVTIRIASNFSREGVSVSVPVEPTLLVSVDGGNLRGFGMQTARVTVNAIGAADSPRGMVQLSAPGAFLPDTSPPMFDEFGVATATLRTDNTGPVTVTALVAGYAPGSKTINVIWPWPTLLATSIGGFIGGFIRLAGRIRKGMNVAQFALGLLVSIFIGAVVFALYVVGVKLLPVTFSVEIGDIFAFAAAALAGWLGTGVLPKIQVRSA